MSIPGYKRMTIALATACVGFMVLCGFMIWRHGWLTIRVAWASEQTKIFDEMRRQALQSDTEGATRCLNYVVGYYPSGSKQPTGSRLDQIVERERALAASDIVAYLRAKTGEDLGENPETWIEKYTDK